MATIPRPLWRPRTTAAQDASRGHRRSRGRGRPWSPVGLEVLEDRTLLTAQAYDLGPIRLVGEFAQSGNTYTASAGEVEMGLVPAAGETFLPLLQFTIDQGGTLTFTTGAADPSFTVSSATMDSVVQQSSTQIGLWSTDDAFTFDVDALAGGGFALSSGSPIPVPIADGFLAPGSILLTNPGGGTTSDAEVVLGGTLAPTTQSSLAFSLPDSNPVTIDAQGPSLGSFSAPLGQAFDIYGLTIDPAGLSVQYTASTDTFIVIGTATVSSADGGLSGVNADFGTSDQPGLTIADGAITGFSLDLEGSSTSILKLSFSDYDLTLTTGAAVGQLVAYGSVTLQMPSDSSAVVGTVGSAAAPGLSLLDGTFQDFTFDINGSFSIGGPVFQIQQATVGYVSDTTFEIVGTLTVPEIFDAQVTLASPNGLEITDGQFHVDGITIQLTDVYLGAFVLDDLLIGYTDQDGTIDVDVTAKFWFPGAFWVQATLDFIGAELNTIGLEFKLSGGGQGIAVGDTGLFIIGLGAEVQNLTNPRDLIVSGFVALSYGPQESFTVFGTTVQATLLQIEGDLLVDRHELQVDAQAYVGAYTLGNSTSGLFGEAKGALTIDWSDDDYELDAQFGLYDGTFKGNIDIDLALGSSSFAVLADVEVDVPDSVPFIGGDSIGSLHFAFIDVDGKPSQTFVAAWARIDLIIHTFDIGFEYVFDGHFKLISGKQIDAINKQFNNPAPQVYTYTANFLPPAGATHGTFLVDWGEALGTQSIAILPPNNAAPIPSSQFSYGNGLSLVPQLTTSSTFGVHLVGDSGSDVVPLTSGPYQVIITSNTPLNITWDSIFGFTAPTIALTPPEDQDYVFSPVPIPVSATVENSFAANSTVTLFVDTDSQGYNGRPVTGAINVPFTYDTGWTLPWDLESLDSKPYYLYASINDGFSRPVYSAYIGPFTPVPPIGGIVADPIQEAPVPGVTVFLDLDGDGLYTPGIDPSDVTDEDGAYAFFGLSPIAGGNVYTVGVVVPPGFQLDPASPPLLTVEFDGTPVAVNFGLDEFASINGTVFVDADGDGVYEPGEPPLPGWIIFLDSDGDGRLDDDEVSVRSNSRGAYSFHNLTGNTTYTIARAVPPGFATSGEAVGYTATIGSDQFQQVTGLNFGARPFQTVSGNVAGYALNGGTLNPDTTPLEGWSVVVTSQAAINAGGAASGAYDADGEFSGGQTAVVDQVIDTSQVSDPAPQAVYQSSRYDKQFSYVITGLPPNAPYIVRLDFAETYWTLPGQRVFDVAINGQAALSGFDIVAAAGGKNVAIARSFAATAGGDGTVTLSFTALTDNAQINGIEVTAATGSLAIDAGGGAAGAFVADADFQGGQVAPTFSGPIDISRAEAPAPLAVYQTNRYDKQFSYALGGLTPDAPYAVRLHFAETYWTAAGQRLFDVAINGQLVLDAFDILATAGGPQVAIVLTFDAQADASGTITLDFSAEVDNAQINGIEVVGGSVTTVTDASGDYAAGGLRFGRHVVSQAIPPGWRQLDPATTDLVLVTPTGNDVQTPAGGLLSVPPAVADLDDDGDDDLAWLDAQGANVWVASAQSLANPTPYPLIINGLALVAADIFGTGQPGVAVVDSFGEIVFFRNDGAGQPLTYVGVEFQLPVTPQSQFQIIGIAAGRFVPGDGGEDQIAVLYQGPGPGGATALQAVVAYFDGGEPQIATLYSSYFDIPFVPLSLATGDVNADGYDDLFIGFQSRNPLLAYGNASNLLVTVPVLPPGGPVVLGDINHDGRLDVGAFGATDQLFSYAIQNSSGFFDSVIASGVGNPAFATNTALLRDLNGDLLPDLVAGLEGSGAPVLAALNTGQSGAWFVPAGQALVGIPGDTGGVQFAAAADLAGDGQPNLVVLAPAEGLLAVVGNNSVTAASPTIVTLDGTDVAGIDFVDVQLGQVNGSVFDDVHGSGNPRLALPGRAGEVVYLDGNHNGQLDAGEPSTITNEQGRYAFNGLLPGTYTVRLAPRPDRRRTFPAADAYEITVAPGSPPAERADFGTTAAIDLAWSIPAGAGWTLVRRLDRVEVHDSRLGAVMARPLDGLNSITIAGAAGHAASLTIDLASGGLFAPPGGIRFQGSHPDDRVSVRLGPGGDLVEIDGTSARVNRRLALSWSEVASLRIDAGRGDDRLVVTGRPVRRAGELELRGGEGHDVYDLAAIATRTRIVDPSGIDALDFHRATASVRLDAGWGEGRWQALDRLGNLLAVEGSIEIVAGSPHADVLVGDMAANLLLGRGGADLLIGRGGADLLIGGLGNDRLVGRPGEDLLIGSPTTFDAEIPALRAIFSEWTSGRPYATRIANLTKGSGSPDRLNGDRLLNQVTVPDDLVRDVLNGGRGRNWFVTGRRDVVVRPRPFEVVTPLVRPRPILARDARAIRQARRARAVPAVSRRLATIANRPRLGADGPLRRLDRPAMRPLHPLLAAARSNVEKGGSGRPR